MTAVNGERSLQHIRRLAGEHEDSLSDGELLRRYLAGGNQSAFAALVRRHGPMVFSVCRSVLRQRDDAEDAFQAAFLVLARKGGSIRKHQGLGGWLQSVAYRVALKLRAESARRQAREAKAACSAVTSSASDDLTWGELRAVLHAELAALPEFFREPLVLCYLEGLTQDEAAVRLGCTATTVKGRIQRGREKLRRRLERRGVALTAALGAALAGQAVAGTVARAARQFSVEAATPAATLLARSVLGPLVPMKWALLSGVLLSAGLLAGVLAFLSPMQQGGELPAASAGEPAVERLTPRSAVDGHGDPLPEGAIVRLGTLRFNHGDGLKSLHFAPDGKTIISQGSGAIRSWDAATGKELDRFRGAEPSWDDQTVLLPDGRTLISLNQEAAGDEVQWWDLSQKKETRKLTLPMGRKAFSAFHRNALSPDGKLCVCVAHTPAKMEVFDLATGKQLYKLARGDEEDCTAVFAGSDRLVTLVKKQIIGVYQTRTGKRIREFDHGPLVAILAASADGRWLATLEHQMLPFQLPNGKVLQLHDRDVIHIWDLTRHARKHSLATRPKRWHIRVQFSPDGKLLFATNAGEKEPIEVTVWDVETGQRVRKLGGACGRILAVSPDNTRLAEGDECKFYLWDLNTGRRLSSPDSPHALTETIFISPTGDRVLTFGDASISAWDGMTGRRLRTFDLPRYPYSDPSRSHSFSPDGRYALSFEEHDGHLEILIWDIASGRQAHRLQPPGTLKFTRAIENVTRVFDPPDVTSAFAPDSSLLATRHQDKEPLVRIWDVRTGAQVRSFRRTRPVGLEGCSFPRMARLCSSRVRISSVTRYPAARSCFPGGWNLRRVLWKCPELP
jgi:RNA polymerase sigma factor (sigma-70 family)